MSLRAMTWVWDQPIAPNHKIVLLAIADHAHDDGTNAWPSAERISAMTGYSVRSVRRLIHEMVGAGYLRIEHAGTGRSTSRYAIPLHGPDLERAPQYDTEGGQPDTPPSAAVREDTLTPQTGHRRPPRPDTGDHPGRTDHAPHIGITPTEPSPEPSENPAAEDGGDEPERIRDLAIPDQIITPADLNPVASDRLPVPADRHPTNPWWNALEDTFGYRPTGAEARHWGKLAKELQIRGADPTDVGVRARRLVAQWGLKALTPASLVKHWDRFGSVVGAATAGDEARLAQALDRRARRDALLTLAPDDTDDDEPEPEPEPEDPYHRAMQEARAAREAILAADAEFGPEREEPAP